MGAASPLTDSRFFPNVRYRKSSTKHPPPARGGGGLIEMGGLCERRGGLFNLETTLVTVLHQELDRKVETLHYKKSEGLMQLKIKNKLPVAQ